MRAGHSRPRWAVFVITESLIRESLEYNMMRIFLLLLMVLPAMGRAGAADDLAKDFAESPLRWHSRPLWLDIGPETAAARNALFGMRAELYSTGFPKTIND